MTPPAPTTPTRTHNDMDLWGRALAAQLNVASQDLGHDVGERLRVARQVALQARPMPQRSVRQSLVTQGHGTLGAPPDEGLNLWQILASALPLLALVSGLLFIQVVQDESVDADMASLDSALLLDELPPNAYTDPGFVQFLRLQLQQDVRHD